MSQPPQTIAGSLRSVRMMHPLLLFTMFLYAVTAEKILPQQARKLDPTIGNTFPVLGILIVAATMLIRLKLVGTALDALRATPDDRIALGKWRKGVRLTDVLLESLALYGFALRFLGGTLQQSLPFYAGGIGGMILWWPERP